MFGYEEGTTPPPEIARAGANSTRLVVQRVAADGRTREFEVIKVGTHGINKEGFARESLGDIGLPPPP